jgi:Chemoreceptor zinc-binding domain
MTIENEIIKAIEAHWRWKKRLRCAIDSGKSDANQVEVAKDNVCEFGRWLYGSTIPTTTRASVDYLSVRKLHADFHKCAANVLECVANGQKAQADALMDGEYAEVSVALIAAMMKWKAAAH